MSLPKFEYPRYTLKLPSSNKEIDYRPYNVRQQKILIQALEFKDDSNIINTITDIVDDCTFNKLKLDELPPYDLEYIFLFIKAKSTGDNISVNYICKNQIQSLDENGKDIKKECGTRIRTSVNLLKTEIIKNKVEDKIKISESTGMKLKYPSFGSYRKNINLYDVNNFVNIPSVIYDCLEYIWHDEEILKPDIDFTREDCEEFIENLTVDSVEKIIEFFQNIPKIKYSLNLKCPKCGKEESVDLEGINDFLA